MARGKGRKNESTGKARVNRDLGKGPATGRTGGGAAEASPERDRARQMARMREAEPIQKKVHRRGASRVEK
jgi:hypothetical protein